MKIKSGGGITSNKYHTSKSGGKVEPIAKKASPAGVNKMGVSTQFDKEPVISGPGYTPDKVGATGVGKATVRPDTPGPGSGRTTYSSGSQGSYGPVAQGQSNQAPDPPATAPGRDILSDYGKERR